MKINEVNLDFFVRREIDFGECERELLSERQILSLGDMYNIVWRLFAVEPLNLFNRFCELDKMGIEVVFYLSDTHIKEFLKKARDRFANMLFEMIMSDDWYKRYSSKYSGGEMPQVEPKTDIIKESQLIVKMLSKMTERENKNIYKVSAEENCICA